MSINQNERKLPFDNTNTIVRSHERKVHQLLLITKKSLQTLNVDNTQSIRERNTIAKEKHSKKFQSLRYFIHKRIIHSVSRFGMVNTLCFNSADKIARVTSEIY